MSGLQTLQASPAQSACTTSRSIHNSFTFILVICSPSRHLPIACCDIRWCQLDLLHPISRLSVPSSLLQLQQMSDLGRGEPTEGPADDVSEVSQHLPPKQRFKASAQSEAAASPPQQEPAPQQRDKRPLSAVLDDAEEEIVAIAQGGSGSGSDSGGSGGSGAAAASPADSGEEHGTSQRKQAKQPRQQDSLIRNIAQPHKPRIGREFQAELPAFNPNHPRAQP